MSTLIFMRLFAAILAICGAIFLAYIDIDGWGWFLLVGLILGGITMEKSDDDNPN